MALAFSEIPVVDVSPIWGSPAQRQRLADALTEICHEVGFFVVTNHGVDSSLVDDVFAMMQTFFAFPDETKRLIDKRNSPHFRGWEPVGAESTNNRPDIREQIDLWSEWPARPVPSSDSNEPANLRLLGPNQWLPDEVLPGHRALIDRWFETLGHLADDLMRLLSLGLGLGEEHLCEYFGTEPMSLTKLISYPPTPKGAAGVNAHHDTGFLTVLAPGTTPGLEVQNPDGQWIAVPPTPEAFVINLGEMFQAITGNYFVATKHRVITKEPRMSAGYFHGPSLDAPLNLLPLPPTFAERVSASPRHRDAGYMAARAETEAGVGDMESSHRAQTYGEQLWNYFARSYPDNMALHHADLL